MIDGYASRAPIGDTRQITKHNYLVMNVERFEIVREAFFLVASVDRPGAHRYSEGCATATGEALEPKVSLNGYLSCLPTPPTSPQLQQVLDLIKNSKRPVVYAGGGCLDADREPIECRSNRIRDERHGSGKLPAGDDLSLSMLGMHGAVHANGYQ